MATFLDRLQKFDVEWEVNNCLRSRQSSPSHKSDERSTSSDIPENRKRKLGSTKTEPIEVDISDLMDHSIELDFSAESSPSESINSSQSSKISEDEPPKKKRRLSSDLPEAKPKPDLPAPEPPKEVAKQMLTTTVTTPTAIITISSPSETLCSPVIIQNDQKPMEQIEAEEQVSDQALVEEDNEEANDEENAPEEAEPLASEVVSKPRRAVGALKATAKVAAWIAWSGLFFALGRMSDPSTMESLFP